MKTKQQKRQEQKALQPGQNIAPPTAEQFLPDWPRMPRLEDDLPAARTPPAPSHPAHQLRPEQWVLLELSKAAMYTADEARDSAQDARGQMGNLQALARDIMGFRL